MVSASPEAQNNDGAVCNTSRLRFDTNLSVTKDNGTGTYTAGTITTYTIVVKNNGNFGAGQVGVSDPLPQGITTMSYTCLLYTSRCV